MGLDRSAWVLPFILSLIAGSTDTIGFVALHFFTAHITGNAVVLATHLIDGDPALLSCILAVPVFVVVLLLTSLFASRLKRSGVSTLQPLLCLQLALLVIFLVLCVTYRARFATDPAVAAASGMFGVAAMAVQTALVQICLTNTPSTTVMTTNVAHFVIALAEVLAGSNMCAVEKARKSISHIFPVIAGFALGCAAGAAGEGVWGSWSLALPTGLGLLALIVTCRPALAS